MEAGSTGEPGQARRAAYSALVTDALAHPADYFRAGWQTCEQ